MMTDEEQGPVSVDGRLARAWEALDEATVDVVSTDVFDTLVWRQVPEPVDAFPVIGERLRESRMLAADLSPRAFGRLRFHAERTCRERRAAAYDETEIRLDEIYALLPEWVFGVRGGGTFDRSRAVEVEVEVERELVVPDLDVVDLLIAAGERGKRVVAVSDTYFSEAQLRRLFDQPLLESIDWHRVFTSADHRTNKSGGLFDIVLDRLDVRPQSVLHMGDNEEADGEFPSRLGISTLYFERQPALLEEVTKEEERFLSGSAAFASDGLDANILVSGLTATRAKVVSRAERDQMPPALRPYWDYGATVLGPVLSGFAEWCAVRANDLGIPRLGCLMREGAFLAPMINRAAQYMSLEVQADPLFLNRFIVDKASIGEATPAELEPFLGARNPATIRQVCRRLGIDLGDMPRFVAHADTRLDDFVIRQNFLEELGTNPVVREAILTDARELRARVRRYVESRLHDGVRHVGVVDLGWAASTQRGIGAALANAGKAVGVTGFYLVTHEGAAESVLAGTEVLGFLGNIGVPRSAVRTIVRSPEVLEQVLMPDHGTQIGLTDDLEPVLEPVSQMSMQAVEADAVRRGIFAFQRHWERYVSTLRGKVRPLGENPDVLRAIYLRSVVAPTEREATYFGQWLHDENRGAPGSEPIAGEAVLAKAEHMDPLKLREVPMSDLYWPFALASRVDPAWRDLIAAAAAGQIPWDALAGSPADLGKFHVWASRGSSIQADKPVSEEITLNRRGLGFVTASINYPQIQEVTLRPSEKPCVMRIDWLEFTVYAQGRSDPSVVRLDDAQGFARLQIANVFQIQPNLFVIHGGEPRLIFDVEQVTPRIAYRVDVECGFAAMPISFLLPSEGRFQNIEVADARLAQLEQALSDIQRSPSWRITKPLRAVKRAGSKLR